MSADTPSMATSIHYTLREGITSLQTQARGVDTAIVLTAGEVYKTTDQAVIAVLDVAAEVERVAPADSKHPKDVKP